MALSERRAMSARDRLTRLGLDSHKLKTLPKGELEATGTDEAGWAHLGSVGTIITKQAPDFDPRSYGYSHYTYGRQGWNGHGASAWGHHR